MKRTGLIISLIALFVVMPFLALEFLHYSRRQGLLPVGIKAPVITYAEEVT